MQFYLPFINKGVKFLALIAWLMVAAAANAGAGSWPKLQAEHQIAETDIKATGRSWYVRPVAPNGTYGSEDGTSFANAFNGLTPAGRTGKGIIWGAGGVMPGDTLYICGNHWLKTTAGSQNWTYARILIPNLATTALTPLTIRGDAPEEAGTIWAFGRNTTLSDTWTGPDANGVYRINRDLGDLIAEDVHLGNEGSVYLKKMGSITWTGNYGAFCRIGSVTYVKTTDGASPAGRLYTGDIAYRFGLLRNNYITFKQLKFNGFVMDVDRDSEGQLVTSLPRSSNITFDGCEMRYTTQTSFFRLYDGNNYWKFYDCTMEYAPTGIYTLGALGGVGASFMHVRGCTFRHMGVLMFPHQDAHGIGVQRGQGHIIERSTFEDMGSAIEFWTSIGNPMRDMIVRYNYIKDVKLKNVSVGSGIVISGEPGAPAGERTGFEIYGNIVADVYAHGISSNSKDSIVIANNVLYNCDNGLRIEVSQGGGVNATVKNNIILNPRSSFLVVAGVNNNLDWDHNIYHSTSPSNSRWHPWNSFEHWRNEWEVDENSSEDNPGFVSSEPIRDLDFKLKATSTAINAGANVGIASDYLGIAIPQKGLPDIGAFEFGPVSTAAESPWAAYE